MTFTTMLQLKIKTTAVDADQARKILTWELHRQGECPLVKSMIDYIVGNDDTTTLNAMRRRAYQITRILGEVSDNLCDYFVKGETDTWFDVILTFVEYSVAHLGSELEDATPHLRQAIAKHLAEGLQMPNEIESIHYNFSIAMKAIVHIITQLNEQHSLFTSFFAGVEE